MSEINDGYTNSHVIETKRLLHTFYDECVVEERNMWDAMDRLIRESEDGPYKDCYVTAKKNAEKGGSIFGLFETVPEYQGLFLRSVTHELAEGEKDGSLFDRLLPIYKAVKGN